MGDLVLQRRGIRAWRRIIRKLVEGNVSSGKPFAEGGIEKMLYDVRMGPQAVHHNGVIYIVYQANLEAPEGHPHIRAFDVEKATWSESVQIGSVSRFDHHFAPILWFDASEHLHVLYNCHGRTGGSHIVSDGAKVIDRWKPAPVVDHSISYPRVLPLPDGRHLMYSRTFGHQGYWTYRVSEDGNTWSDSSPLIDFDQNPLVDTDTWAGTYQSVGLDASGKGLHIAVTTFHEGHSVRGRPNPRYGIHVPHSDRRNLYYAHLHIDSGDVSTIKGAVMATPITRRIAEEGLVWDSSQRMTNPPSILDDGNGNPMMILPVASEESPWSGHHVFIRRLGDEWEMTPIATLNNTWSANWLLREGDQLVALLTRGEADGSLLEYGGGNVEKWTSSNNGDTWGKEACWAPESGLVYNNPRPVSTADGGTIDGAFTLFGWEGPEGLARSWDKGSGKSRGRAFLYLNGEWV